VWRGILLGLGDKFFQYAPTGSSGTRRRVFWYKATRSSGMWLRGLLGCSDAFFCDVGMCSSVMWRRVFLWCGNEFFWDVATRSSVMWDMFFCDVVTCFSVMWGRVLL
jgi:hypothetical protein